MNLGIESSRQSQKLIKIKNEAREVMNEKTWQKAIKYIQNTYGYSLTAAASIIRDLRNE